MRVGGKSPEVSRHVLKVSPTNNEGPRIWMPPTNFKNWAKISKSNSQGIEQKLLYPQNQHDSLNQFQFSEIKKSSTEKSYFDS